MAPFSAFNVGFNEMNQFVQNARDTISGRNADDTEVPIMWAVSSAVLCDLT